MIDEGFSHTITVKSSFLKVSITTSVLKLVSCFSLRFFGHGFSVVYCCMSPYYYCVQKWIYPIISCIYQNTVSPGTQTDQKAFALSAFFGCCISYAK